MTILVVLVDTGLSSKANEFPCALRQKQYLGFASTPEGPNLCAAGRIFHTQAMPIRLTVPHMPLHGPGGMDGLVSLCTPLWWFMLFPTSGNTVPGAA